MIVFAALVALSLAQFGFTQDEHTVDSQPLRALAEARGLHLGASVDEDALAQDPEYSRVLTREFNALTPENAIKFADVHPQPLVYDFSRADAVVDFARRHDMLVHGHVLVWHDQLPEWITADSLSADKLRSALRQHIHRVVGHFRGRIPVWDVVAEAVDDDGALRDTLWLRALGPDYIQLAFEWANEADPAAQLLYNDYGAEGLTPKADAIFKLVETLKQRHVPIHGIGLQMHVRADYVPPPAQVAANMARLTSLGLDVHITEMDVMLKEPTSADDYMVQADIYRSMLGVCLAANRCKSFTTWGFSDRYSWVPDYFPGWGSALIFDREFRAKPAYDALVETLRFR